MHDAPLWISNRILRIYYDDHAGSISSDFTNPKKACESVQCYLELFQRYAHLYQRNAPRIWYTKQLRLSVYLHFSKKFHLLTDLLFYCLFQALPLHLYLTTLPNLDHSNKYAGLSSFPKALGHISLFAAASDFEQKIIY